MGRTLPLESPALSSEQIDHPLLLGLCDDQSRNHAVRAIHGYSAQFHGSPPSSNKCEALVRKEVSDRDLCSSFTGQLLRLAQRRPPFQSRSSPRMVLPVSSCSGSSTR